MRSRTFVILAVIFCLLGIAALYSFRQGRTSQGAGMGEALFEALAVDTIEEIRLVGPASQVQLKKGAAGWEVENLYGYPAEFASIAELVETMSDLKIGRDFTADEQIRERLALYPPQASGNRPAGQQGTRIVVTDGQHHVLADLLIGKGREADNRTAGGHYLMRLQPPSDDTVYLVDKSFRFLKTDPADWAVKDLLDVDAAAVRQVDCFDLKSGALVYRLARTEKTEPAVLDGLQANEVPDSGKVNRVMSALTGLTIDGVAGDRHTVDLTTLSAPRRFEYHLFDGTVYTLETARGPDADQEQNYLKVGAAWNPVAAAEENRSPSEGTSDGALKTPEDDPAAVAKRVEERLRPWTYTISTWKHEALVVDRSGLLKQEG